MLTLLRVDRLRFFPFVGVVEFDAICLLVQSLACYHMAPNKSCEPLSSKGADGIHRRLRALMSHLGFFAYIFSCDSREVYDTEPACLHEDPRGRRVAQVQTWLGTG